MNYHKEVGYLEAIKFTFYIVVQILYGLLIFPHLRSIFLNLLGANICLNLIMMNVKFFNWHQKGPRALTIGKDCFIGDETLIDLYDEVILEDQVTLAQRVLVLTHINVGYTDHPLQKFFPKKSSKVIFKKGAVIGASSTILAGVTIGERSFVAAGSVVTKDVPANTLVGGVPAKVIRRIKQ